MRTLLVAAALSIAISAIAQSPATPALAAREELNLGVQAFKNVRYEEAIEHFKNAASLDPDLTNARLYLATAYAQLYIPGADTPENNKNADLAIAVFKRLADSGTASAEAKLHSMKGIASLNFNMKRLDEAADWYQRVTVANPQDSEAFYSIGVIRWTQAYKPRMELRAKLGLPPTDELPAGPACSELRAQNRQRVEDGMNMLAKALELRPDYDDAMAYMNLIYRERADYECDDPNARAADLKAADKWVDLTMATKKGKAERGGVVLETAPKKSTGGGGGGTSDRPPHLP